MARIVLGPMLRYIDDTSATIWVETDEPCAVTVLTETSQTFTVHSHHYAIVCIEGLEPGSSIPYTVALDGEHVWPRPNSPFPQSRIRTTTTGHQPTILFGSCRVTATHDSAAVGTHGVDTLRAFAHEACRQSPDQWPDATLFLGDQVYADKPPVQVREFIASRRETSDPPGEEVLDYEEYAALYRAAWEDDTIAWFLSTVPTMMIFDDHDIRDDWNTSQDWHDMISQESWWRQRVTAGLASYWIYQHLGNLSPAELADDETYAQVRKTNGDAGQHVDTLAQRVNDDSTTYRWSYCRDFADTRIIVLDSRCARVLTPGSRRMVAADEWEWFVDQATANVRHLVIGSSLPVLLPPGIHYVEGWNESVAEGAWGQRFARSAERLRQLIDLEHWGAFRRSFTVLSRLVVDVATGERGEAPRTILFLSGDVHYSYLMRARLKNAISGVYQVVCSPIRNPMIRMLRWANVAGSFIGAGLVGYLLARCAGVHRTLFKWRLKRGPWFDNSMALIDFNAEQVVVTWRTADTTDLDMSLGELGRQELTPPKSRFSFTARHSNTRG